MAEIRPNVGPVHWRQCRGRSSTLGGGGRCPYIAPWVSRDNPGAGAPRGSDSTCGCALRVKPCNSGCNSGSDRCTPRAAPSTAATTRPTAAQAPVHQQGLGPHLRTPERTRTPREPAHPGPRRWWSAAELGAATSPKTGRQGSEKPPRQVVSEPATGPEARKERGRERAKHGPPPPIEEGP